MKWHIHMLVALACTGCVSRTESPDDTNQLSIFAAASLTTVVPQIGEAFKKQHPGVTLAYSFTSSSMLAKQIDHGAEADIYIAANPEWMDYLEERALLAAGSRIDLVSNKLVIVVPLAEKRITNLADLASPSVARIAVGDWAHVPAGMYAKAALEKVGLWRQVEPKCLPALDVRAALSYVERGEADCGIVYRSDAAISKRVKLVAEFPAEFQPDIRYTAAVTAEAGSSMARDFLLFLQSEQAKRLFRTYGFEPLSQDKLLH